MLAALTREAFLKYTVRNFGHGGIKVYHYTQVKFQLFIALKGNAFIWISQRRHIKICLGYSFHSRNLFHPNLKFFETTAHLMGF